MGYSYIESFFVLTFVVALILIFIFIYFFKEKLEDLEATQHKINSMNEKIIQFMTNVVSDVTHLKQQVNTKIILTPEISTPKKSHGFIHSDLEEEDIIDVEDEDEDIVDEEEESADNLFAALQPDTQPWFLSLNQNDDDEENEASNHVKVIKLSDEPRHHLTPLSFQDTFSFISFGSSLEPHHHSRSDAPFFDSRSDAPFFDSRSGAPFFDHSRSGVSSTFDIRSLSLADDQVTELIPETETVHFSPSNALEEQLEFEDLNEEIKTPVGEEEPAEEKPAEEEPAEEEPAEEEPAEEKPAESSEFVSILQPSLEQNEEDDVIQFTNTTTQQKPKKTNIQDLKKLAQEKFPHLNLSKTSKAELKLLLSKAE
jgi:hypothetical protein